MDHRVGGWCVGFFFFDASHSARPSKMSLIQADRFLSGIMEEQKGRRGETEKEARHWRSAVF